MSDSAAPRIWITYAWEDNDDGDFDYLVQELADVGIEATYDKVELVPGMDLWEQIGDKITEGPLDGWGYLLTAGSLASEACREELAYALNRALGTKGRDFPLIGLLHGVRIQDVPPALKVRLCVSMGSPNWKEEIKAGLERRPPQVAASPQSRYVWQVHQPYRGFPGSVAVEVRPRFGELMYWRFAVPASATVTEWGFGPAGEGPISGNTAIGFESTGGAVDGTPARCFGCGDKLSPGISAYVVFHGTLPEFVGFGLASEPFGPPGQLEIFRPDRQ